MSGCFYEVPIERIGKGTQLLYCNPDTAEETLIGGIKEVTFPDFPYATVDTTTSDSPEDVVTSIPGMMEPGDVTQSWNMRTQQFFELQNVKAKKRVLKFIYRWPQFPQILRCEFYAWIKDIKPNSPLVDLVTCDLILTPTSKPHWSTEN